jgi:phosphatidylserine/phosphatidylglycerophosphate/cardiolipin synthase-like enzyme
MNLSLNGIYGQSNVGHWVEDAATAAAFLDYWERLNDDPEFDELRPADDAASSIDSGSLTRGTTALFSPRTGNAQLQRIAGFVADARRAAFITLPFGIVATMAPALTEDDGVLRCILLDSAGSAASQRAALRTARALPNVIAAIGNRIETNALDAWVQEEANPWSTNVEYVHTKYALIDPLSNDPLVITGSANFSDPSVKSNDENTLVIRGDTRVADIYLGEFRRLFDHHAFRESLKTRGANAANDPTPLKEKPADWLIRHFDDGGPGELRRLYFSGSPVA